MECQFDFADDPQFLTPKIKAMLNDVITHTHEDVRRVKEPKVRALYETTEAVLKGLVSAYERYEHRIEEPSDR